jgi:hypothetical protein
MNQAPELADVHRDPAFHTNNQGTIAMHHGSRIIVFQLLVLVAIAAPVRAQGIDLTQGVWDLLGQDLVGWNDSQLTFTSQGPDGSLTGHFDWLSDSHTGFGRELFNGTLLPDRTFTLHGYQLLPHPTFGGPSAIVLADYTGEVTLDGRQIINGTWLGQTGVPGMWESVRTPEPSTALLLAIGGGALALRRRWRLATT